MPVLGTNISRDCFDNLLIEFKNIYRTSNDKHLSKKQVNDLRLKKSKRKLSSHEMPRRNL